MRSAVTIAGAALAGVLFLSAGAAHAVPPAVDGPATSTLVKKDVSVESEGVTVTIDGEKYRTGPLEGSLSLLAADCADAASVALLGGAAAELCEEKTASAVAWGHADFHLATAVDASEDGDFGQVRLSLSQTEKGAFDVRLRTAASPSDKALDLVSKEPVEITAGEPETSAPDVKSFPPVNQPYSTSDSVQVYEQEGDAASGEPAGQLEAFDVVVNQSALERV